MDIKQSFHEVLLIICLICIDQGLSYMTDDDYFDEPSFNRCPWIRNKLKNGRVRYRYKGRVAKFLCDSGFELAGKRSSTCVRGQWSNPVPVCVARGCSRMPSISNGRITEMYRGALLVYDCNPGYVLGGNPTIHCDGRRWNTSPPMCVIATENPETHCDFENPDLCGWTHDANHDFDWLRNQFSTPSGHVGTGPEFDHTFGKNKAGFYLYIEASSPRKLNDTARLFSPVYPEDLSGGCFIFWYHMYGATTGGLRIYLKPESHVFDELKPNWEKFGDQGNEWRKGHMIVPVLQENFQIVIEGVRGESYVGDSAIDDVRLTSNLCDSDDNSTDITETVDQHSCRGRCQESGSESSCGCNANCIDEPNFCCRDYYTICTADNSTAVQNTDEPLPEDYTTTSSKVTSSTVSSTTVQQTEEIPTSSTQLKTEETELANSTQIFKSSTLTSASMSANLNNITDKPTPLTMDTSSKNYTFVEITTSTETTTVSDVVSSTTLKTEATTTSTTEKTTTFVSTSTPILITDATTRNTPLKIHINTTTPQTTSTTLQTTTPISMQITTSETTSLKTTPETTSVETTPETTSVKTTPKITSVKTTPEITSIKTTPEITSTTLSILTTFLKTTTETDSLLDFGNNSTTVKNYTSFATENYASSSSAATSSNTETSSFSSTTSISTRKTYNLRPRNRTSSTTAYTTAPVSQTTSSTHFTGNITDATLRTSSRSITSWYRYSVSPFTRKTTSSSVVSTSSSAQPEMTTTSSLISQTSTVTVPYTTKFSSQFTKPTRSSLPKTSDFYESKSKTTSSNSSVSVIVSVVVVVIICLIVGLAYYLKKQRSKRQSKLSDDSEMRFLPDSDYMDYSDASALDRILVK